MRLQERPRQFGEIFSKASDTLLAHFFPVTLPFLIVELAEMLPSLAWNQATNQFYKVLDQGRGGEYLASILKEPAYLLLGFAALVTVLLFMVAAYTWAFARVIAYLREDSPNYRGATASLGWFGAATLSPWLLILGGIAAVGIPLASGQGWTGVGVLLLLTGTASGLALAVIATPFLYMLIPVAVRDGQFGLLALRTSLARLRTRLAEFIGLALVLLCISIALNLTNRLVNYMLPSIRTEGFDLANVDLGQIVKELFKPDQRPAWASAISTATLLAISTFKDAYFSLCVFYWYLRKD